MLATKPLLVVACLAVACWAVPLSRNALTFEDFIVQYNRSYSQEEYAHRRAVFEANKVLVDEVNAQAGSWQAQLNEFADLTFDEFSSRLGANGQDCDATVRPFEELRQIPASKDWREAGVITPVKDQGGCLEAHHAIKTKKLVSLSEQNLIDCAQAFGNKGCFGGLPSQAFEYVHYNGGLDTESSYPYRGAFHREACHFNESQVGSTVSSIVNVTQNDETQILNAVGSTGPVSIAYHCSIAFQFYHKGVYSSDKCPNTPNKVNHAVLAVGYGHDEASGKDYWLVKNSWGAKWGLDGYFKIERGKNMCGLATCASYPMV